MCRFDFSALPSDHPYNHLTLENDRGLIKRAADFFVDYHIANSPKVRLALLETLSEADRAIFEPFLANTLTVKAFLEETLKDEQISRSSNARHGAGPSWGPVWTHLYGPKTCTSPFNVVDKDRSILLWNGRVTPQPPGLEYRRFELAKTLAKPRLSVSIDREEIQAEVIPTRVTPAKDGRPAEYQLAVQKLPPSLTGEALGRFRATILDQLTAPCFALAGFDTVITYDPSPAHDHYLTAIYVTEEHP